MLLSIGAQAIFAARASSCVHGLTCKLFFDRVRARTGFQSVKHAVPKSTKLHAGVWGGGECRFHLDDGVWDWSERVHGTECQPNKASSQYSQGLSRAAETETSMNTHI